MAAAGSPQPNRPKAPQQAANKPLQVMKINRKDEQEKLQREAAEARAAAEAAAEKARMLEERAGLAAPPRSRQAEASSQSDEERFDMGAMEGMSMADLMGSPDDKPKREQRSEPRSVDDFDFDEEAFLAALDENAPVGTTGEVIKGTVIASKATVCMSILGAKPPVSCQKAKPALV